MKKENDTRLIWFLFIGTAIVILIAILSKKGYLDMEAPKIECGITTGMQSNFNDLVNGKSWGFVEIGSGMKSIKIDDFVANGDTVCKNGNAWEKEDLFIK